jgi:hypothetical protein
MTKQNSKLIASWRKDQDPLVDPPSSVTLADGKPTSIDLYQDHLADTYSWDVESGDGPRRIIQPSLVATARFDPIAGAWTIGGHGVPRTVLDITDPNATDQEIALEICDWPTAYRLNIKRPNNRSGDASSDALPRRERRSVSLFCVHSFERIHDWLIFGTTLRSAAALHRETFSCSINSRLCIRVLERVRPFPFYSGGGDVPCYALDDDLVELGFRVLSVPGIQAVKLGNQAYVMGYQFNAIPEFRDDQIDAKSGQRPCGTVRWPPPLQF